MSCAELLKDEHGLRVLLTRGASSLLQDWATAVSMKSNYPCHKAWIHPQMVTVFTTKGSGFQGYAKVSLWKNSVKPISRSSLCLTHGEPKLHCCIKNCCSLLSYRLLWVLHASDLLVWMFSIWINYYCNTSSVAQLLLWLVPKNKLGADRYIYILFFFLNSHFSINFKCKNICISSNRMWFVWQQRYQTFLPVLSAISLLSWLAALPWHAAKYNIHSVKNSSSLDVFFLYGDIKVTKGFKVVETYKEHCFLAYLLNWKWHSTDILSLDPVLLKAVWGTIQ